MNKQELMKYNLTRYDANINNLNVKSSLIISSNAILFGFLIRLVDGVIFNCLSMVLIVLILIILTIFTSITFSVLSLFSILRSSNLKNDTYKSILYFGDVLDYSVSDYHNKVQEYSESELCKDLSIQCHVMAQIVFSKYNRVNVSLIALMLTFVEMTIFIVLK